MIIVNVRYHQTRYVKWHFAPVNLSLLPPKIRDMGYFIFLFVFQMDRKLCCQPLKLFRSFQFVTGYAREEVEGIGYGPCYSLFRKAIADIFYNIYNCTWHSVLQRVQNIPPELNTYLMASRVQFRVFTDYTTVSGKESSNAVSYRQMWKNR